MSDIRNFVENEPIFETHNHQPGFNWHDWDRIDYREFTGYAHADIAVASGPGIPERKLTDEEFFQLWPFVRTTGYGRAVELGVRELFDLDYTLENSGAITQKLRDFVRAQSPAEIYADLFKRARIVGSVNDILPAQDITVTRRMDHSGFPDFFRFAPRLEMLHVIKEATPVHDLEQLLDVSITTLRELEQGIEKVIQDAVSLGHVAALKIGVAYLRSLDFDEPSEAGAEAAFSALMAGRDTDLKPLHDWLFHHYVRCAAEHDLTMQIHTGYLAGVKQDFRQGDPSGLIPVFMKYPDVRFDLFHAGWPWSELMGAIGKQFPNVWLDLCWAWSMNPVQMERTLDEWLSCVPSNKILGFGADTTTPFCVVGYAKQARNAIANVMERKIERGEYDEQTARFTARRVLHDNANELFG